MEWDKPIKMLVPSPCDWLRSSASACDSRILSLSSPEREMGYELDRTLVNEVESESERCFHEIITLYGTLHSWSRPRLQITLPAELFFRLLYFGLLDMTDVTIWKGKKMGRQKSFKATFPHVNKPAATCRNIYVRRKRYAKSNNLISLNSLSILLIVKL